MLLVKIDMLCLKPGIPRTYQPSKMLNVQEDSGEYAEAEQQPKKLLSSLARPAAHGSQKFYGAH